MANKRLRCSKGNMPSAHCVDEPETNEVADMEFALACLCEARIAHLTNESSDITNAIADKQMKSWIGKGLIVPRQCENRYSNSKKMNCSSPNQSWMAIAALTSRVAPGLALGLALGLGSCDRPSAQSPPSSPPSSSTPAPTSTPSPPTAADRAAANTLRQQGLAYRQQGRYEEAIAALQQSVELDASNRSGQVILGWTLHLAGREPDAIQQLKQVLTQQPTDVPALNALGIVYLASGDLTAAVQTHQTAVALQPDNEIAYFNLSLAYQRLQRHQEAIAAAQRATQLEPENPHPWLALAIAHWGNGETALAQVAYTRAIRLDARYRHAARLECLKIAAFSPDQIQLTETIRQSR